MPKINLNDRQAPLIIIPEEEFVVLRKNVEEKDERWKQDFVFLIKKYIGDDVNPNDFTIVDLQDSKDGCICFKDAKPELWATSGYFRFTDKGIRLGDLLKKVGILNLLKKVENGTATDVEIKECMDTGIFDYEKYWKAYPDRRGKYSHTGI